MDGLRAGAAIPASFRLRPTDRCAPKGHPSTPLDSTTPRDAVAGVVSRETLSQHPAKEKASVWHPMLIWLGPRSFYLCGKGGPKPAPGFQPGAFTYVQAFFWPKASHPTPAHALAPGVSCVLGARRAILSRPIGSGQPGCSRLTALGTLTRPALGVEAAELMASDDVA